MRTHTSARGSRMKVTDMTEELVPIQRITISMERPEYESRAREFCATIFPGHPITAVPLDEFADSLLQLHDSDEMLIVVLHADAEGHLVQGSPFVQQLMNSQVPVLVLRQPEGVDLAEVPFTRVVVPLDGSSTAGQAIPLASRVAQRTQLPVKFVMVIDPARVIPPAYAYDPEAWGVIEELRLTSHWALGQAEAAMQRDGVEVTSDLLLGALNASLMAAIGTGDLVVMTTHGLDRHNLRYRDSVAMRVLVAVPQPILIMQAQPQETLVVDGFDSCGWAEPHSPNRARIA